MERGRESEKGRAREAGRYCRVEDPNGENCREKKHVCLLI
jgi:hypothetical protein